jgi:hypothetical protein
MSKITNVRLPNASPSYDPSQINQLVRSLEQVIFQLNNTYTSTVDQNVAGASSWFANAAGAGGFAGGIRGFQLSNGISLPYAMLMSTVDQPNPDPTAANALTFDQVNFANGISVVDNSKIYASCAGQYLVTMTLQAENGENDTKNLDVWAVNSGTIYPYSRRSYTLQPRKNASTTSTRVLALSGIFTVDDASTEYLEINWWGETTTVDLFAEAATTTPDRPAIPSAILTINFISAQ